jgi:hypothetical protein
LEAGLTIWHAPVVHEPRVGFWETSLGSCMATSTVDDDAPIVAIDIGTGRCIRQKPRPPVLWTPCETEWSCWNVVVAATVLYVLGSLTVSTYPPSVVLALFDGHPGAERYLVSRKFVMHYGPSCTNA